MDVEEAIRYVDFTSWIIKIKHLLPTKRLYIICATVRRALLIEQLCKEMNIKYKLSLKQDDNKNPEEEYTTYITLPTCNPLDDPENDITFDSIFMYLDSRLYTAETYFYALLGALSLNIESNKFHYYVHDKSEWCHDYIENSDEYMEILELKITAENKLLKEYATQLISTGSKNERFFTNFKEFSDMKKLFEEGDRAILNTIDALCILNRSKNDLTANFEKLLEDQGEEDNDEDEDTRKANPQFLNLDLLDAQPSNEKTIVDEKLKRAFTIAKIKERIKEERIQQWRAKAAKAAKVSEVKEALITPPSNNEGERKTTNLLGIKLDFNDENVYAKYVTKRHKMLNIVDQSSLEVILEADMPKLRKKSIVCHTLRFAKKVIINKLFGLMGIKSALDRSKRRMDFLDSKMINWVQDAVLMFEIFDCDISGLKDSMKDEDKEKVIKKVINRVLLSWADARLDSCPRNKYKITLIHSDWYQILGDKKK